MAKRGRKPKCTPEVCKSMREYKAQGHTVGEVAKAFGVSEGYTKQICKGIAPQKAKPNPALKGILQEEDKVSRIIRDRLCNLEYAGNYTGSNGTVDLQCTKCGTVITRSWISVRHSKCRCDVCYQASIKNNTDAKDHEKEIAEDRRKRSSAAKKDGELKQLQFGVCVQCGEIYYKPKYLGKYCSKKCQTRAANQRTKHTPSYNRGSDDRLNKANVVDRDITLRKLFDRDNGRCQICGKACDWNDYMVRDNGVFVAGDFYPSIDHIIPLSLGGKHSWVNIRLAHRNCNTKLYYFSQRYALPVGAEG